MGRLTVEGIDTLSSDFAALARLPDSVIADILNAGADVITAAQRDEIRHQWRGRYTQEISANSVQKGKPKKERDGQSITVYPKGSRKRGGRSTRNAEIAFVNEYGKRGQPARPAIRTANTKKENEAADAGERVYNAYLDSRNL